MAHTYWQLYYHFVWTTKGRMPQLTPRYREPLLRCIAHKCQEERYVLQAVNAVPDHVHLCVAVRPAVAPAVVAKMVKGSSSHFVNAELAGGDLYLDWQDGYGVLSLSKRDVPGVVDYIRNQDQRHRNDNLWPAFERCEEQ